MIPKLKSIEYLGGYRLYLEFEDGKKGEIDLQDQLWGHVFEPLRELDEFKRFEVHPEMQTLTWPNGADLAPEYLYDAVAVSTPA